jgi:hypothetical protein
MLAMQGQESKSGSLKTQAREFELPGEDAILPKDGERLILEPAPPPSLRAVLATARAH